MIANFNLKEYNTFGLDVSCQFFAQYNNVDELIFILNNIKGRNFMHIGRGSNLLFLKPFAGVILHSNICYINKSISDGYFLLDVGAGVIWDDLCKYASGNNIYGFENLSYIPGEVGSAAVQNIGAYGVEVKDLVYSIYAFDTFTNELKFFNNSQCEYGYRDSIFKNKEKGRYIIISVKFKCPINGMFNFSYKALADEIALFNNPKISDVRDTVIKIRESKLPNTSEYGNAGSFFKNPTILLSQLNALKVNYPNISYHLIDGNLAKISAAWLIDNANLKGHKIGGAKVYEKQPLVIINYNNATANDILELANYVVLKVNEKFNINLEPEVNYINI